MEVFGIETPHSSLEEATGFSATEGYCEDSNISSLFITCTTETVARISTGRKHARILMRLIDAPRTGQNALSKPLPMTTTSALSVFISIHMHIITAHLDTNGAACLRHGGVLDVGAYVSIVRYFQRLR